MDEVKEDEAEEVVDEDDMVSNWSTLPFPETDTESAEGTGKALAGSGGGGGGGGGGGRGFVIPLQLPPRLDRLPDSSDFVWGAEPLWVGPEYQPLTFDETLDDSEGPGGLNVLPGGHWGSLDTIWGPEDSALVWLLDEYPFCGGQALVLTPFSNGGGAVESDLTGLAVPGFPFCLVSVPCWWTDAVTDTFLRRRPSKIHNCQL